MVTLRMRDDMSQVRIAIADVPEKVKEIVG
jgi:glycyl-tRNA synthetase (class II)